MKNIDNNIRYEMYDSIWKYSWQPVRDIVHSNVSVDIIKKDGRSWVTELVEKLKTLIHLKVKVMNNIRYNIWNRVGVRFKDKCLNHIGNVVKASITNTVWNNVWRKNKINIDRNRSL